MSEHTPKNPDYEAAVRESFARQGAMTLIGARLLAVQPGRVQIELPFRPDLSQQHGFFHAGVTTTIADSAAGYAAFSLYPRGHAVLTVEFKVNLLAPADGERLVATGRVKKPGRTLTVCEFEVEVWKAGVARACAYGIGTMICLPDKDGRAG
jgi:uncharacterized protein (TIGR00369 family)